ncbi:MAG: RNHCP domain-containing protein [Ruminococcaceae bacterium]|nr:RNHCP domain-containing protein [Oscillospiraceae bacterium]
MESKRFTKNDSGFICGHCQKEVKPLGYTSRNHCPYCLWSRHMDENPGDRASECRGLMEPVSCEPDSKKGYIIIHKCTECGAVRRNKAAYGPKAQSLGGADDLKLIISLTGKVF